MITLFISHNSYTQNIYETCLSFIKEGPENIIRALLIHSFNEKETNSRTKKKKFETRFRPL